MSLTISFQAKADPNNETSIIIEFYIPKSVRLEVLYMRMVQEATKINFPILPTAAILDFSIAPFMP